MPHLYISYAKQDARELSIKLANKLNMIEGLSIWLDRSLSDNGQKVNQHEIVSCDAMIVLYSPAIYHEYGYGDQRSVVLKEIEYAKETAKKPIIPIMVQKTNLPDSMQSVFCIDLTAAGSIIDDIAKAVCNQLELEFKLKSKLPDPEPLAYYEIQSRIGGSAKKGLYLASCHYPETPYLVTIKEIVCEQKNMIRGHSIFEEFEKEMEILSRLNHPAIPKIHNYFTQENRAYVVTDYVQGLSLEAMMIRTGSLPIPKLLAWAIDLCDVLHYMHSQEEPIIFGVMRPTNIFIDKAEKVHLMDFAIVEKLVRGLPQTIQGGEGYKAPEQYKGKNYPVSDVFGLGATLHHVITRTDPRLEPPFTFEERSITVLNSDTTLELEAVIMKAVEFEPEKRYSSIAEMKAALESIVLP